MGDVSASLKEFFHAAQLLESKHCVELAWPPIVADIMVKVWLEVKAAVIAESARGFIDFLIVGRNHPALAGRQDFRREKRE